MRSKATRPVSRAWQIPEPIAGYRVGWFSSSGLLFAEGRARPDGLCVPSLVPNALEVLRAALERHGIGPIPLSETRLRRLDIAVDLQFGRSADGLSALGQAARRGGKVGVYRDEHCVETVVLMTPSGKTKARIYDKGRQMGSASRGRWVRFEAQWLFPSGVRPLPAELGPEELRERFAARFSTYRHPSSPPRQPHADPLFGRMAGAIEDGDLLPSRARSLVGYLFLTRSGIPQGARRTVAELEHECRELGLSIDFIEDEDEDEDDWVDLNGILQACLKPEVWE